MFYLWSSLLQHLDMCMSCFQQGSLRVQVKPVGSLRHSLGPRHNCHLSKSLVGKCWKGLVDHRFLGNKTHKNFSKSFLEMENHGNVPKV